MRYLITKFIICIFFSFNVQTTISFGQKLEKTNTVFAGLYSSFAIINGSLWAWGDNENGHLGDGTTQRRYQAVKVGNDQDWVNVSYSLNHTLALKIDGTLWRWGYLVYSNSKGDLIRQVQKTPIQMGKDTTWRKICSYRDNEYGIKSDGTLWAWRGSKLGDGTLKNSLEPIQIGRENNWLNFSAGVDHIIALKKDGSLWAWGSNEEGRIGKGFEADYIVETIDPTIFRWKDEFLDKSEDTKKEEYLSPKLITKNQKWKSIGAGKYANLGVTEDGKLWAWGSNVIGEFGNGSDSEASPVSNPVQIGKDSDWKTVFTGWGKVLAIKNDGSVWQWASPLYLMGKDVIFPTKLNIDLDFVSFSIGGDQVIGLKLDGSIWVIGENSKGELGLGAGKSKAKFTPLKSFIEGENNSKQISSEITPNIIEHCADTNSTLYVQDWLGIQFCANNLLDVEQYSYSGAENFKIIIGSNFIFPISNYPEEYTIEQKQRKFEEFYVGHFKKNNFRLTFENSFKNKLGTISYKFSVKDKNEKMLGNFVFSYINEKNPDYFSSLCFVEFQNIGINSADLQINEDIFKSIKVFKGIQQGALMVAKKSKN